MRQAHRSTLHECVWTEINEAGAYVDRGRGDLYRIPKEALSPGGSPIVIKESYRTSRMARVSKNPFISIVEARLQCARHNIPPNF